ncbi:Hypothetical predicted protein [Mytilus galloprovincialis]|uniref:Tyr recombinase domain-containing protein n=1 Tax=Mytilus galloprovincialis TaxID=29158 RepID=A0A8B6BTX3_MYTGA|nr:Hypothetical predicted protein [Mytilus galloprovincialis]
MANAQLNDIPLGMATPSRESGALDSEDHRVIDENVSFTAVAVETDKVVESLGSSHKARRNISSRQDDEMSLVDGTEEDVRQSWSDLDTKNPKRKRDDSVPSRKESSEDNEAFDPEPSLSKDKKEKVPSHVTKYIEKYALKGISKKTRQDMSLNWPIPSSKGLKALETDRFFKKNYFQGRKWNARLERSKINTQLRILDVMGPLSRLWSEAHRIKKDNQGMDPSDVIQLTQRAIVLAAGAHKQPAVCGRQTSSPSTSFREETLAGKPVTEQTGEQLWSAPESAPEPDPEPNPDSTSEQPSVQETCKPIERVGQEKTFSHIQNYFQLPMNCIINQNSIPVGGRVSLFLQNWNSITKDPWVLQCVKGIKLDFLATPFQNQIPNQAFFNQENQDLINKEITGLLNKKAITQSFLTKDSFISNIFLVPKKGGGQRPVINLKGLNVFFTLRTFQNGGNSFVKRSSFEERLDGKNRPNRCIFDIANSKRTQKIPQIFLAGKNNGIQVPPVWDCSSPKNIHKTDEGSHDFIETFRCTSDSLPRRYSNNESVKSENFVRSLNSFVNIKGLRFSDQYKQVSNGTFTNNGVSGLYSKLKVVDFVSPEREGRENKEQFKINARTQESVSKRFSSVDRSVNSNQSSCPSRSSALSQFTNIENKSPAFGGPLRSPNPVKRGSSERVALVGNQAGVLERESVTKTRTPFNHSVGCKSVGMGSNMSTDKYRWALDRRGKIPPYKSTRTKSSNVRSTILCQKSTKQAYSYTNGQHNSNCICKQNGGNGVKKTKFPNKSVLGLVSSKAINNHCGLYIPGKSNVIADWESRHYADFSNWRLSPILFKSLMKRIGPCNVDLFADRSNTHLNQYFSWKPDPQAKAVDALLQSWREIKGYAFPPVLSNKYVSGESSGGKQSDNSDNSSLAIPGLVPSVTSNVSRLSSVTSHESQHCIVSHERATPTDSEQNIKTSRVDGLRRSFNSIGISEETKELLLGSWKSGTRSSYDSAWNKSTKKPFKGLSSQTVGNWIKWVMKEAGIDISLFQAHSCRMVSTSKAAMSGISMDDIMSMADWSNTRTFNKFYFRTNEKAGFADKVLEMVSLL